MKTAWFSLCAGLAMFAAAMPCRAQQRGVESTPILFVYVAKAGENALPRIALGLEQPALKISAFEKCVRLSTANPELSGLAVRLKADDARTVVAAIKALGAPDARQLPDVVIWFTTLDNKALNFLRTGIDPSVESDLVKDGIMTFYPEHQEPLVRYLNEKLHPE